MIDEHLHPTRERERQLRDFAVACELSDVILHGHNVVRRGIHEYHRMESLNKIAFRRFLLSLNDQGRGHLQALFDIVPDELMEKVEAIAMCKPAADIFGRSVAEAFNSRNPSLNIPLVVLGDKEEECKLSEEHASSVPGKKILIVDSYRDLGGTMTFMSQALRTHGGFVLAAVVFLELLEHALPVTFPVFSVRKKALGSVSATRCAWCSQQRARSKH